MCNMHAEDYGRLYFSTLHSWDINCIFFFRYHKIKQICFYHVLVIYKKSNVYVNFLVIHKLFYYCNRSRTFLDA